MPKEDPFVNRAQLLRAIKKYPEIWDSNNKLHMCRSITAPMWAEIAEQFGGAVATVKLQSIWSQMKYHYHNLVHRQILHKDRFTTKWEHFEPMSFMYNITMAKIVGTSGGGAGGSAAATAASVNQLQIVAAPTVQGRGRPSGHFSWSPSGHQPATFTAFSGLVPPPASQSINVVTVAAVGRKTATRSMTTTSSMRSKIIEVIRKHPVLWTGRREQRQPQNRTSAVWKEVAAELGLSTSLVQTRWSIIKQRYVDELQKERYAHCSQKLFYSTWEHFDRMSFMREILEKKVDDREHTRERIQEIVSVQQQQDRFAMSAATSCATAEVICVDDDDAADGHRHPKTETADLEWDPFEMILHVNGPEAGN